MADFIPTGWPLAIFLDHWLLYTAVLLAAGSALFIIWMPAAAPVNAAATRVGRPAALVAIVAYGLAIGLGGADLLGTPDGLFAGRAWTMGARTTLLTSAVLGGVGMILMLAGLFRSQPWPMIRPLGPVGIGLAIASLLVTGHPVTTPPRWLILPAFAVHLLTVAFWLGALWPLKTAAEILPPREAGRLMALFSRRAFGAVAAVIASGVVISWVQLGTVAALAGSAYGQRLMTKLALVAALLALAGHNKFFLTPALTAGDGLAATHLRRTIALELILFVMILAAAVVLTQVTPPRDL